MIYNNHLIERLQELKSNYTSPESAQDQANSLESLSTDIYTDSKRFIYELLQNADDASSASGKLDLQINFIQDYIIVSHQGNLFTEIDIESICSVGDGNKTGDEKKTGFKGIGFKSVFSHSDYVIINTGDYSFRFDKHSWKNHWVDSWGNKENWKKERKRKGKDTIIKMPWQIIPIKTNLEQRFLFAKDYNVSTIIKHDNIQKLKNDLFDLFSNTQILLFLRSKEVKITILGKEALTIEKIKLKNTIKLKRNGKDLTEWLLKSFTFKVDSNTKDLIEKDVRIPKKLRQANSTEISFALQLKKGKIKVADEENRLVFTYLPTSVNYDFPFLVNASFLTDAGRQHIHEDLQWNIWLFKQIPFMLFDWIAELAQTKYKNQIFNLIPNKFSSHSELKQSFNEGFEKALNEIAFIPNKQGKLLKVNEVILDKTNISNFLDPNILVNFINSDKNRSYSTESLISFFKPLSTLRRIGIEVFEIEHLDKLFASIFFQQNHKRKENFNLIKFLYEQSERFYQGNEKRMWNQKLRNTPFIFDENKNLQSPKNIYFPSIHFSDAFADDISIIHSKTMIDLEDNHQIKLWLEYLGVQEPSDISFIEKSIVGNENYITSDNAIEIGRYLFNLHKKGLLNEHYWKLKRMHFLTQENNLVKAQDAFLADFYEPELRLESSYKNDFYVSDKYYSRNDLKSEWKTFFTKIGVCQTIQLQRQIKVNFYDKYRDIIENGYYHDVVDEAKEKIGYPHLITIYRVSLIIDRISFSEIARRDYNFSKLFWNKAFEQINIDNNVNRDGYMIWGHFDTRSVTTNYFFWSLENSKFIPTTEKKCRSAKEVFINSNENRELAGKYLPVFDYEGTIPEQWLKYLPFKKALELDDYLTILSSIWQDTSADQTLQKENQKRIGLIYERIANEFLGYGDKLSTWGASNKFLAKDGKTFFYPSELSVVKAEGFNASNLAFCDEKNDKVIKLLQLFGINIIDKVKSHISNSKTEIQDLKKQLKIILPLIAVVAVEKSKSKNDWEKEFGKLSKKLQHIRFFDTTEIYLSYGNDNDRQKRSSWAEGNNFYYVGNWYKPRILDSLIEPLGKFLGIRYAERHLSVLLSDNFKEGIEYLKEKFGLEAIDIIPKELLNPTEAPLVIPNSGNRAYNQSDEDLGHKGELYVYSELKKIYEKKYNKPIVELATGFKIDQIVEVIWRNKLQKTNFDHDFKITENGSETYIDSKATPYREGIEKVPFYISANEFTLMESTNRYLIARVFSVTTTPTMKLIRLNIDSLN